MIQRIQSLYLLIGGVLLGALFFTGVMWSSAAATAYAWFTPVLAALTALTALMGWGAIALFKNRPLQRRVVVGAQVLIVLAAAVLYGALYAAGGRYVVVAGDTLVIGRLIALALPLLAYGCFYLARRRIDQDIALVRSMDRLR